MALVCAQVSCLTSVGAVLLFGGCAGKGDTTLAPDYDDSALLFKDDFESGAFTLRVSGNLPEVIESQDARAGNYVMQSQITPAKENLYRTEGSVRDDMIFEIGQEYWTGISIKLGEDFKDGLDFEDQGMVLQWHYFDWKHPDVPDAQPLVLRYIGDDTIGIDNEVLRKFGKVGERGQYMATVPAAIGEWVDWVFHYKLDDVDGIIRIWRNGELVVDWKGDNHQIEKHDGAYLKFGLYSAQFRPRTGDSSDSWKFPMPEGATRTVYHDELRIAGADGSYKMVAPRAK